MILATVDTGGYSFGTLAKDIPDADEQLLAGYARHCERTWAAGPDPRQMHRLITCGDVTYRRVDAGTTWRDDTLI